MEKRTILFMSRPRRDLMFADAIRNLSNSFNIVVIATEQSKSLYRQIPGVSVEVGPIVDDYILAEKKMNSDDEAFIRGIEKEFGINCFEFNLNYLLYRKFASHYGVVNSHKQENETIGVRLLVEYKFLKNIVDKYKVDYCFYDTIDLINSRLLSAFANKGVIRQAFEHRVVSVGGELRIRIATGQRRDSKRINYLLERGQIGTESYEWAKDVLQQYKTNSVLSKYDIRHRKQSSLFPKYSFQDMLKRLGRAFTGDSLVPFVLQMRNRLLSLKYFSSNLPEGKILSYFLQLTPEASICSQAPQFADQNYLIEQIAIHAKYGFTVVVKEHPSCFGKRLPQFYKDLSLLPNVVLLPPSFPTRDLLLASSAVVVATGTSVGMEAIATCVPVIAVGQSFFDSCKNVRLAGSPTDVWNLIDDFEVDEEEQLKYVAALYEATYNQPQYENQTDHLRGKGVGQVLAQALTDEISLYEEGCL